jgi:hypothetical protein
MAQQQQLLLLLVVRKLLLLLLSHVQHTPETAKNGLEAAATISVDFRV